MRVDFVDRFDGVHSGIPPGPLFFGGCCTALGEHTLNTLHVDYCKVATLIPYARNPRTHTGAQVATGPDMPRRTMDRYGQQASQDRRAMQDLLGRRQLTGNERQVLERIKQTWRQAMAQPLLWGKDLERELIAYMERNQGRFYRAGGLSRSLSLSASVPAMLTPGKYVVNRAALARLGTGFFEALGTYPEVGLPCCG